MLTTTNMQRHTMRKARQAHRSRKAAYADARRQGRIVHFGFTLPYWADPFPDNCSVADYIASQFSACLQLSPAEE